MAGTAVAPARSADPGALVLGGDLPRLVQIGRGQQGVGQQEIGEVACVTPLLPDEPLEQLLVVGHRAFPGQVQRDDHVHHRGGVRCGPAKDVLLVVEGHCQPRRRVALEIAAHVRHRVVLGRAAVSGRRVLGQDPAVPGGRQLVAARARRIRVARGTVRCVEPQRQHPAADAYQPRSLLEHNRQRLIVGRSDRQNVAGHSLHGLGARQGPAGVCRQVYPVGRVAAEQLPPVVHVAQARAPWRPVQREVFVSGQQAPVKPRDLVGRACRPLVPQERPDEELAYRHSAATPNDGAPSRHSVLPCLRRQ